MSILTTTPSHMCLQQPSWTQPVIAGLPAWQITTSSCTIKVGKANIDADALLRVSWPGCIPDSSDAHQKVTAAAVLAVQEAALKGPGKPHRGLQLQSACPGCSPGQPAGHLYDLRGLVSSPRSGSCPEPSHH